MDSVGIGLQRSCSITCRKRHKKCNEVRPGCGNCSSSNRACIWPESEAQSYSIPSAISQDSGASQESSRDSINPNFATPLEQSSAIYLACDEISQSQLQLNSPILNHVSPSNTISSEFLTADLASVRWLDLLAGDAEQANRGFTRPSSPVPEHLDNLGFEARARIRANSDQNFPGRLKGLTASEGHSWQLDKDIVLEDHEVSIFRNFVEHSALWLDLFDPHKHFSIYTTRLALRNIGLMKAILALSAQHLSRQAPTESDPNLAIQYYYETLHYVQTALQYNSYTHSEELLATALIISTYEMLDESESGWQRHLKGVFWIQRSQDVNGGSGGIRQSVWWAWLRQDVWAAFRERRRCLSFWKPVKDYDELSQPELIDRATYLFSQAVNFCADSTSILEEGSVQQRNEAADALLTTLDRWKSFFGDAFKPLPVAAISSGFQPIWIHPPQLGYLIGILLKDIS